MTTDLEDRLCAEFIVDALRAPITAPEWTDVAVISLHRSPQRRRFPRVAAVAAALVLVGGGIYVLALRRDVSPASGFIPPGEELPLTEISIADLAASDQPTAMGRIAKPGSVHLVTAPGVGGWVMAYDALDYTEYSGTVQPFRCIVAPGMGMCLPTEMIANSGSTNGEQSQWINVPAGTSVVEYVDGAGAAHWQRPIGGMSIFPVVQTGGQFTAYADDGAVLATLDFATTPEAGPDLYGAAVDTLTVDQEEQMHKMVVDITRSCLIAEGATFPMNEFFPVMPTSADPAAWESCVATTKAAVEQQFADWGGTLAEPSASSTASTSGTGP